MIRRPCLSSVSPFEPTYAPGGAGGPLYPLGLRNVDTLPSGVHFMMALLGMSLNKTYPSFIQMGPSTNPNPPASFSILAPAGRSSLRAGSISITLPVVDAEGCWVGGFEG